MTKSNAARSTLFLFMSAFMVLATITAQADQTPAPATMDDMKIFDSYIGKFRSESKLFDDSEIEYHFTVSYDWFDKDQTIVKYVIEMEIPEQERTMLVSEGFYSYEPFNKHLYVYGAFTRGQSGWGSVGVFDHETGARETWARSMQPDGVVLSVRDTFKRIDDDHWSNKTWLRNGDDAEWVVASEDTYTRMQ